MRVNCYRTPREGWLLPTKRAVGSGLGVAVPACRRQWAWGMLAVLMLGLLAGCSPSEQSPPPQPAGPQPALPSAGQPSGPQPALPAAEELSGGQSPGVQVPGSLPPAIPGGTQSPAEAAPGPSFAEPPTAAAGEAALQPGANPLRPPDGPQPAAPNANPRVRPGKHGEPFDPIKENGPIFVGWPKPRLALVITGRQEGYLEPCGCAGLDRMKGGMSRRHTLFGDLRRQGWPVVGLDAGSIARGFGPQAEMKFHIMVEAMRTMGYQAINLGRTDLGLPAGELVSVAASLGDQSSPFLSANVGLFGFDAGLTARTRLIEAGGIKLGVTGIIGLEYQKQIQNNEIELAAPEAALAAVLPQLKAQAEYLILLCSATKEESEALARKFPDFHLVVTTGGGAEPPPRPSVVEGTKTYLIEVGEKGMDAVVWAFFDDAQTPFRYQRVPLDSRFPASREMYLLMVAYQENLKARGLAGLGLRPVPHPQREQNGRFVGSEKCANCHEVSYSIWKKSGHARAFRTLVELDPPRQFDPECISCHVIGWHPTQYFPYESGYLSAEHTPELTNVGCECCHGPGEKHVLAEMGSDLELQRKSRQAVVITKEEARQRQCYSCHDLDNSPDFDFDTYWPLVEHYEGE